MAEEDERPDAPASKLAGTDRYEVLAPLGQGGMGLVHEARDRQTGTHVALKTLRHLGTRGLLRFKKEFRSLQGISHPNLVQLHELGEADGEWFFTMELVFGTDFDRYVRHLDTIVRVVPGGDTEEGAAAPTAGPPTEPTLASSGPAAPSNVFPYDEDRLRSALWQLVSGLGALHAAGKVHRDIKPSNVLVSREDKVVLVDFGLVKDGAGADSVGGGAIAGTAAYMAPEQAAGKDIGPAADLYAVGVMLYEVVAGRLPFAGAPLEMLCAKQARDAVWPEDVTDAPADLRDLAMALLVREPGRRPAGAEVLARIERRREPRERRPGARTAAAELPELLGRAAEVSALVEMSARVRESGKPEMAVVRGPAGIGKTAVVDEAAARIRRTWPDALILRGRCYENEQIAFKAFDAAMDQLARRLLRLAPEQAALFVPTNSWALLRMFPTLTEVSGMTVSREPARAIKDPHELRRRGFGAVKQMFGLLGERQPVVLVADDLQWADPESWLLLCDLLAPPDVPALLVIGILRPEGSFPKELPLRHCKTISCSTSSRL